MLRLVQRFVGVPLIAVVMIGVVGCAPPSGLPDARQYDLGKCGMFEARIAGQDGGPSFLAARQYGIKPPVVGQGYCSIVSLDIGVGPDSSHVTTLHCDVFYLPPICLSYSAGFVGGVWYQSATSTDQLQSARVGLTDTEEPVPSRWIQVYP